jgi:hypothetical protein
MQALMQQYSRGMLGDVYAIYGALADTKSEGYRHIRNPKEAKCSIAHEVTIGCYHCQTVVTQVSPS